MSVRILAFFDTRYQASPEFARLSGSDDPWHALRNARPPSRQYDHVNWPSSLGTYDLGAPNQAASVVGMAAGAGVDGFVVAINIADGRYFTGVEPLIPLCRPELFGLAFHWANGKDPFWASPAARDVRKERARALVAALPSQDHVYVGGRPILIIDHPQDLAEPAGTLALIREEAKRSGLPDLYIIANRAGDTGLQDQGYDAAVDPDPGDWPSCQPKNKPSGLEILEIRAGLRDSVEWTDKFYPYALFAVSRMINRQKRGKVFPRVFPAYQNWPTHLDGDATVLTNRDSGGVDRYIFGLFVENAITFAHEAFPADERLVFVDSWNHWLDGSQVEPSTLDGDLVYNTLRAAIDKGRYMIRTRGELPSRRLGSSIHDMISQICDAAAAAMPTGK
ncbi:glycoside hydrolase family 99-like domain-containing protein [Telmatospirillum sp.]|uniref:glycoside hydrolase family 99-like domain-containing protein n=1 Tax=Telmatospirillum sp. TaxID=2079197 RepID=UPI00284AD4B4|nr:glycoside hydrolase family 99-like domain-containing protein [Telmatospirillum sp.]MDR3441308.1 glycoside hydrolase family 99-like domain-containing protein [Telmatospirillum sp.]